MKRHGNLGKKGMAAVWGVVTIPVLVGFVSFGVDVGRMQLTKSELQSALDASTRYAVTGLGDSTAAARAIAIAGQNTVLGKSLTLVSNDVLTGSYDSSTGLFTSGGTPTNAVLVRKTLTGNQGVPLLFGSFFGFQYGKITVASCATTSGSAYTGGLGGFVGRDWFNINGPLIVRAWDSATQTTTSSSSWAVGQTQGNINLNSGVSFQGEIQHTAGGSVSMNSATVTKGITNLASPINYPMPTTASGTTNLSNYNGPSGASQTFTAGKYYADTFNVPSGKTVVFSGPVELYVNGSFNVAGAITTYNNVPGNLKVNIVSGAGGDIGANASPLYMDLYAPGSPFNLNSRTYYGSLICVGVNVNSSFTMNIDRQSFDSAGKLKTTLSGGSSSSSGGAIRTVAAR